MWAKARKGRRMKDKKPWIILGIVVALLAIPALTHSEETEGIVMATEDTEVTPTATDKDTDKEVIEKNKIPDDAIGMIEIESLDIRYPIYEGATEAQLSKGIGHLPETAGLLETGNCVCCGHNGSSRGLFFTTLSHIRKGARVKIETKDHRKRTYSVTSTKVVGPHDATVRKKSDKEILKLFTCAYHGTRRFVAVCEPVDQAPAPTGDIGERM